MKRATLVLVALSFALTVPGCIGVGGATHPPTKGQELLDLKVALDKGAIDQAEYDAAKLRIVNR